MSHTIELAIPRNCQNFDQLKVGATYTVKEILQGDGPPEFGKVTGHIAIVTLEKTS